MIVFIDDATSKVVYGQFVPAETTQAYFDGSPSTSPSMGARWPTTAIAIPSFASTARSPSLAPRNSSVLSRRWVSS